MGLRAEVLAAVAAAGALGLAACATAPDASRTSSPAAIRGQAYALADCAGCHAVTLEGLSPNAYAPPFRTLRTPWTAESLMLRLQRSPIHHGPDMPTRTLHPEEAKDLVAYLAAVQAGKVLSPPAYPRLICKPFGWC
jgi:mono/diheme cytochrome c family protein